MRYTWSSAASPVQEIQFFTPKKARAEALIFAPLNGSGQALQLDALLAKNGFIVSYDIVENRPALRVSGFENEKQILDLLEKNKLVEGAPEKQEMQKGKESLPTLILSAAFYQMGNVTGLLGDFLRGDKAGMTSNALFVVGDSTMLAFGKKSMGEKQHAIFQGFGNILKQNGLAVEPGSAFAPEHIRDLPGTWNAVRRFMTDKVIVVKSLSEVGAGLKKAQAGFFNQGNPAKGIAGLLIAGGFGASALLPEKTPSQLRDDLDARDDADLKAKIAKLPLFRRILVSVQKKPLLLSGGFSFLNNIFSAWGAFDEKNYYASTGKQGANSGMGRSRKEDEIEAKLNGGSYDSWRFGKIVSVKIKGEGAHKELENAQHLLDTITDTASDDYLHARKTRDEAWKKKNDLEEDRHRLQNGSRGADFFIKPKHFWMFDLGQAMFFAVANFLYSISPKGGSLSDRKALADRFFAAVATEIAKAPEHKKEYLFAVACQYIGNTRDIDCTAREAQKILAEKVQLLNANPWANKAATPQVAVVDHGSKLEKPVPQELLTQPVEERRAPAETAAAAQSFAHQVGHRPGVAPRTDKGWESLAAHASVGDISNSFV